MKKLLLVLMFFVATVGFAQPVIDGAFDGVGVWGSAKATADGAAGWSNANAKEVYVTFDATYIYLGAKIVASSWMSWCFLINTKTGGASTDSWSRDITNIHTNLPDFAIRGNFNNGWTEINIWNGTSWTGTGTSINSSEHGDNITGTDISGWVEVRVPRTVITEVTGDIEFFISGDNNSHGSFDSVPDDDNSTSWSSPGSHSDLVNYITSVPLPVEITSFTASASDGRVDLNWSTATEVNNYGFEIQRASSSQDGWEKIGFVEGHGNSNSIKNYEFTDSELPNSDKVSYRLKQIDIDGGFKYSDVVEVSINKVAKFNLAQNYPNPFNPATEISFSIPKKGNVKLTVYNSLGQEAAVLVNKEMNAGSYNIKFNANRLTSGIYFYKLQSGNFVDVKKMIVLK